MTIMMVNHHHTIIILLVASIYALQIPAHCEELIVVDFRTVAWRPMPQFWSNTGLCPPSPTNSSLDLHEFFASADVRLNLNAIAALPASMHSIGVRVHWILNLIDIKR